jgi:MscS family membrane protein
MFASLTRLVLLLLPMALLMATLVPLATAQTLPGATPPPEPAPSPAEPVIVAADSPRASLRAFLEAARAARWDEAAQYLSIPETEQPRRRELAERLKVVLDRYLWFDLETVSPLSTGRLDDGLAEGVEEIGDLQVGDARSVPIRLVRETSADGARWVFAGAVVQQIDGWHATVEGRWFTDWLARSGLDVLLMTGPLDILWWQWMALLLAAGVAWLVGGVLGRITRALLRRVSARTATSWDDRLFESIGSPLVAAWTLALFALLGHSIGLSVPAERIVSHLVNAGTVVTVFWLLWRAVNVSVELALTQAWALANPSARHLLTIGSNLLKGAIAGLGGLALLAAFGYPVTTLLAGLGIGGLAFAFGAQKTVENLFGSIALAVDQPMRVGDFVKVEDFVGTVEDIGLRSTRFRTLDRTIITIPNGKLADQRVESFAVRDRMRLATVIGLEYRTTGAQMQQVIEGFERVLRQHPWIWPDAVVVKFQQFGASSLDIEVMAWFAVPEWGKFQTCRQEVLLGFMQVVEEAGTAFAFPTRTVHLVGGTPAPNPR